MPYRSQRINDDYYWSPSTVGDILERIEYLGKTVNFKTYRKSYKNKKAYNNDKSKWQIYDNTQDPIIDKETFDIVQKLRSHKKVLTPIGTVPLLSGIAYCDTCGKKLYQVRNRNRPNEDYLVCGNYRKIRKKCTSHSIKNSVLEKILLTEIQKLTTNAHNNRDEFLKIIKDKTDKEIESTLKESKKELDTSLSRYKKLDEIIKKLYEDNISEKISDERFKILSKDYESEQHTLKDKIKTLEDTINTAKTKNDNVDKFLKIVDRYTDIKELTPELLHNFIDKVYVSDKVKVNGKKTQNIRIVWNCIGALNMSK